MASTGVSPFPQWQWPQDIPAESASVTNQRSNHVPGAFVEEEEQSPSASDSRTSANGYTEDAESKGNVRFPRLFARLGNSSSSPKTPSTQPTSGPAPNRPKHWPPRQCRICLETVNPTFHAPPDNIPDILQPPPHVTYDSEDPASGRLLRPCKCKGSSKYVHEGCLKIWRYADPGFAKRNYWQCPTCGFRYRLQRMRWAAWISSTTSQVILTAGIFFLAMFLFGFIADPIISLYLDPYSTLLGKKVELVSTDGITSWPEHFIKGLATIGLLSFVKFLFALSPWEWWNVRSSGILGGGGRRSNGRDRLANISWVVVLIGVGTFLWVSDKDRILTKSPN